MTTKRRVNVKSENSAQERPALAEIVETGWDMDEIKRVQEVEILYKNPDHPVCKSISQSEVALH